MTKILVFDIEENQRSFKLILTCVWEHLEELVITPPSKQASLTTEAVKMIISVFTILIRY